jgi:hypothetical protein
MTKNTTATLILEALIDRFDYWLIDVTPNHWSPVHDHVWLGLKYGAIEIDGIHADAYLRIRNRHFPGKVETLTLEISNFTCSTKDLYQSGVKPHSPCGCGCKPGR